MSLSSMTSLERVFATLAHKEPDRVPLFLSVTLHGAKMLGMSIREYYSKPENVIEGQLRMRTRYQHDNLTGFFYASQEIEAFGGETIFIENGPPNAGEPILHKAGDILDLQPPRVKDCARLQMVLETQRRLKDRIKEDAPIVGVVISPFSLPVMQMGFEGYLDLLFEAPELFERLMRINEEFCVEWANAQLANGATAICYFDPVSSPTIIPRQQYLRTGFIVAQRTLARINGPTATHFASGRCLPILEEVIQTGSAALGVGLDEDLHTLKNATTGRIALLGNLNNIEMRLWSPQQAEAEVKKAVFQAAAGGGFILSDIHGEIPFQVPDEVLLAIGEAVRTWGAYPIRQSQA